MNRVSHKQCMHEIHFPQVLISYSNNIILTWKDFFILRTIGMRWACSSESNLSESNSSESNLRRSWRSK